MEFAQAPKRKRREEQDRESENAPRRSRPDRLFRQSGYPEHWPSPARGAGLPHGSAMS
jgi:hypothetical protein